MHKQACTYALHTVLKQLQLPGSVPVRLLPVNLKLLSCNNRNIGLHPLHSVVRVLLHARHMLHENLTGK